MLLAPLSATRLGMITPPGTGDEPAMARTAAAFEEAFLSEMLRAAGSARSAETLGGGIGEEQFASFLALTQARALMEAGGLGLTPIILASMQNRTEEAE